jgi:hypothetical protein
MYLPTPEMVAVTWLRSLTWLYSDLVTDADTALPDQATWTKPCYLQATHVEGVQDNYSPQRNPYVFVDVWGARQQYEQVSSIAETIVDAALDGSGLGELVVKAGFWPVRIADVSVFVRPRPIRDDPASLARSNMTLAFTYVHIK